MLNHLWHRFNSALFFFFKEIFLLLSLHLTHPISLSFDYASHHSLTHSQTYLLVVWQSVGPNDLWMPAETRRGKFTRSQKVRRLVFCRASRDHMRLRTSSTYHGWKGWRLSYLNLFLSPRQLVWWVSGGFHFYIWKTCSIHFKLRFPSAIAFWLKYVKDVEKNENLYMSYPFPLSPLTSLTHWIICLCVLAPCDTPRQFVLAHLDPWLAPPHLSPPTPFLFSSLTL